MDKSSVSGRSAGAFLALGLVFFSVSALAQPPSGVFIPGADRYLTFVGHNNEEVRIVDTDGGVTVLNRAQLRLIHPVVPGPPRPVVPDAVEAPPTITAPPLPEEVDFADPKIRGKLSNRIQHHLTEAAVPRLRVKRGRLGGTVAAAELSAAEQDVVQAIGADLSAQASPLLPKPYLFGPKAPRGRVAAGSSGITLAEAPRRAKESVEGEFAERVVPRLPANRWAQYQRSSRYTVPRRGVVASELRPPLPLHLLQQPAAHLPVSARDRRGSQRSSLYGLSRKNAGAPQVQSAVSARPIATISPEKRATVSRSRTEFRIGN